MNKYIKMSIATMFVMFIANYLSAQNQTARKFLKGAVVSGAGDVGQNSNNVVSI